MGQNGVQNFETKKKVGFESIFEDPNRKVSPSPLPIACCLSLFLYLTGHFPLVPSPVMGFPVAMCFDTGFSIATHRGYCFLSWQSDCHVVCQVLKYIIFSKAAALHSVTLWFLSCSSSLAPLLHSFPKLSAFPDPSSSPSSPGPSFGLAVLLLWIEGRWYSHFWCCYFGHCLRKAHKGAKEASPFVLQTGILEKVVSSEML